MSIEPKQTFKITITCHQQDNFLTSQRKIAGLVFSNTWWNALKYYLSTHLASEGLLITKLDVVEIEPTNLGENK
jgi:hypothetical protein